MDTFVDSNWYYFRYCDPHDDARAFDPSIVEYWLPVDQYIGGIEHAVMHLIYTRYWTKVMRDLGLVKLDEPVANLLTQGMINKETFKCPRDEWLFPEQVTEDGHCLLCGSKVEVGRVEKMSKSKKNAVDPIEMINIHGADALRLFVLFAGPPEKDKEWSDTGFEGAARYLQRVWRIAYKWQGRITASASNTIPPMSDLSAPQRKLRRRTHQLIRSITENFEERLRLNTCISSLMELTNELYAFDAEVDRAGTLTALDISLAREATEALIRMLTPFCPHIAEELWEEMGHSESLARAAWPDFNVELTREEEVEIAVQVNGKLRTRVFASPDATEEQLRQLALADSKVMSSVEGHEVAKVIVIPRRLVNVVVR
jgi:leucyl-tRNA synthetase